MHKFKIGESFIINGELARVVDCGEGHRTNWADVWLVESRMRLHIRSSDVA